MAENKNIGRTAEQVIALGDHFQSILDMAQALKGMTSVENAIQERQIALAKVSSDHEKALSDLKVVQDQAIAAKAQMQAEWEAHNKALSDQTGKVMADASKSASDIIGKAHSAAEVTTSSASEEASRVKTASEVALAAAQKRLSSATKAAADVEEKLAAMQMDHDVLAKKMADLRSAAQKLAS